VSILDRLVLSFFSFIGSWWEPLFVFVGFLCIFLLYLLALRYLAKYMDRPRYIVISTLLLGIICICIPVLPSQDVYSYIAYARMGVMHDLNPLTTLPTAIASDPIFSYLYWTNQPSAYGPTWTAITSLLQWLLLQLGFSGIIPMVIALRILGLLMHLGSVLLIWSICGHLQYSAPGEYISRRRRKLATVAFAWNPLLLFEAVINAHNDTSLLFFILLALWFLVRTKHSPSYFEETSLFERISTKKHPFSAPLLAAVMLALATCLKVTAGVLFPGLLLYLWMRQRRSTSVADRRKGRHTLRGAYSSLFLPGLAYGSVIVLLYAPVWAGGAVLTVFRVNPAVSRDINSVAEFLTQLYNGMRSAHGAPIAAATGSAAENFTHTLSTILFGVIYALFCWRAISPSHRVDTLPRLIRWWMSVWLLYCAIGTAWFWPWYTVTFFGLEAILEARSTEDERSSLLHLPLAARLLAFSMLSVYGFYTPVMLYGFVRGLPGFLWTYFRGVWAWAVPLLAVRLPSKRYIAPVEMPVPSRSQEEAPVLTH